MKRFAAAVIIPLCAGYIFAQQQSADRTETTTTTKTTWDGTLIDAGCYKTYTEKKATQTSTPDPNTTRTETTRTNTESVNCPATTTTTTFGLLTTDGKYVRFDDPSNTRVIQVVKNHKDWKRYLEGKKPMKVSVVGTRNGDTVVVETIR